MTRTFTNQGLTTQVIASLGTDVTDFDVQGIVEEIWELYGDEIQTLYDVVDIDQIDSEAYWNLVSRHDIS